MSHLAWMLATCPDMRLRNDQRAMELPTKAVEGAPERPTYWNTLGVARYRAGDFEGAVEALNKSIELRRSGDPYDWFFLAMAEWQLDQKEEARIWHVKASQWMKKNAPQDQVLRRFCAESANLLQIGDNQNEQKSARVN